MQGFKIWLENDLVANAKREAENMVSNPNPRFKDGFGKLSEIEELAATIYSAKNGYPDGTKQNSAAINIHMPYFQNQAHPAFWLLRMVSKYKIPNQQMNNSNYSFGKDASRVNELIELQSNHKDPKHWDYAREIGKLLGYSNSAIETYISRSKDLRSGKKVLSIQDMRTKEY